MKKSVMISVILIALTTCSLTFAIGFHKLDGVWFPQNSAPDGNPDTDTGWLYCKDAGGVSTLYWEDDAGTATALTSLAPTTDLVWEGSTADAHEAIIRATDPTSDTIWTLPVAAAGTYSLMSSTLATNALDVANSVTGASNALVFEGTADAFEVSVTAADATADATVTIPARTGTVTLDTKTVTNKADEDSPVTTTCGGVWTNSLADGACVFNLPEASTVIGQSITFAVAAAQNLDINPDDADTVLLGTNAAGDALRCATAGSTITLLAIDATNWVQVSVVGTWSDVN